MSQQPPPSGTPEPGRPNPYEDPAASQPPSREPVPGLRQPLWEGHRAPEQGVDHRAPATRGRPSWPMLAVGAFVVLLVAGIVVAVALTRAGEPAAPVEDLRAGDCLSSDDLRAGRESISSFEVVACDQPHDAEVFSAFRLDPEAAADFDLTTVGAECVARLERRGTSLAALGEELEVRPLVATADPDAGDRVVCFLRNTDGDRLSDRLVE